MTIILASVSNQGHVASSDGRTISGSNIVSENTNKTFSLYNGKIRGSYAGMMPFGSVTVQKNHATILLIYQIKYVRIVLMNLLNS